MNFVEAIQHDYHQKFGPPFSRLSLPLRGELEDRAELPLLFTSKNPLVLSHGDLCEMNIFVQPNTGHMTGIVDCDEARILPFGISLWGFENMLGYKGMALEYHNDHHKLENLFWQTFEEAVRGVSEADR